MSSRVHVRPPSKRPELGSTWERIRLTWHYASGGPDLRKRLGLDGSVGDDL